MIDSLIILLIGVLIGLLLSDIVIHYMETDERIINFLEEYIYENEDDNEEKGGQGD